MNYRVKFVEDAGILEVEIPEGSQVSAVSITTPRGNLLVDVTGSPRLEVELSDVQASGDVVIGKDVTIIKNKVEVVR